MFTVKLFSAQKATATSVAIPIQNLQDVFYRSQGAAFAIQAVNVGAEAAGRTCTFAHELRLSENAPFHTPEGASDIKANYACDGAALKTESWSFSPHACVELKIVMTLSGALTYGLDVYLNVW